MSPRASARRWAGTRTGSPSVSGAAWMATRRAVNNSSPVAASRSPSTRARPAKVRDACSDDGAVGAGSGPSRWARHARIAAATSATDRGSSTGTIACSWRANTSTTVSFRNEQMVSTWPVDRRPSAHAAAVIGRWVTSRATRVMTAARGRAIRPRSVIHAVIEVAPTVSHNDAASTARTAAAMRASSRSRRASTAARSRSSTARSRPGDGSVERIEGGREHLRIVHLFAYWDTQNHRKILTNIE